MWRYALSRQWWAGHVLVVAFSGLFLVLARWQWDRAHSPSGDWQNLGYALQWPLFAVFLVVAWGRFLWLERHREPADRSGITPAPRSSVQPTVVRPPSVRPTSVRPTPEDDPDDELTAYNAYLAQLAAQDQGR